MNKYQIADMLKDYHWMLNEITRLRNELKEVETVGISKYGEQADMPHGTNVSDPILNEVIRREKKSKRQVRLEEKVMFLQQRLDKITDEREKVILDCLLDGMSVRKIAHHMGFSYTHTKRIIDEITEKLVG